MIRPPTAAIRLFAIALVAMLLAACSPQAGALGSPATPPPTGDASVEVPSDDATPGVESPSQSSLAPSPSPSASSSPASAEPSPTTAAPTTRPTARPTTAPAGSTIVRAYFFLGSFTDNAGLVPVLREVPETVAVATAAVRQLLAAARTTPSSAPAPRCTPTSPTARGCSA